ncbi:peptidyl-prolyl cis-trans isomerase C [Cognatiyoonia koreensis]|uniref:Parvulin-like PPIase n=1 Tax=Cognatiyoonia koreensis TaxID=364200 RepID=A0A1I0QUC3_9RHOB|nr:peptidylprolyl isomerase [Cognatiyoonia koreensis]SEW31186.1 peptidyl-prolyl cis-trans isomerase C [Cognatiyoonia koreensis]
MQSALFPELVVNGEQVPHALIAAETQNQDAPKGKPGIAWRKAANAVAIRTLLLQQARDKAIKADPQEVGPGRFETEEEALIRTVLELEIDVQQPSETDVKSEWEKDPGRFRTPPLWEVSHILCACDPRDTAKREQALARANGICRKLESDPKGFAALAARESDCGSKSSGGVLGQLGPGDTVPEFETALRHLSEGQVTNPPILTRHGYHVIRLDALAVGQVLPFEAVKDKIALAMEKAAWARQSRAFIDRLVAASDIKGADFRMV